jgi:branched-chain amino acid transport system permease protein
VTYLPYALDGLSSAAVYALYALAIVFVYRTSRILLFCAGEIGVMSAYVLTGVLQWAGNTTGGFLLALAVALLFDLLVGVILFFVLRQEKLEDPFTGTAITIAFAILLDGCMTVAWSSLVQQMPFPHSTLSFGGAAFSTVSLAVIAIGGGAATVILTLFHRTPIGVELQALANNRSLAKLSGIPVESRMLTMWIAASVISGLAGILAGTISAVSAEGAAVGFSGLVSALIGGLTNPGGALIGALLLAAGENVVSFYFDIRYSIVVPVVLLVALLAIRPRGISARIEHIVRT